MKSRKSSLRGRVNETDIRLLRVFSAIVECSGFSAAEIELNIGRSAISSHMADLETKLDMRLCQRGRGGFLLTDQGRQVYEEAQVLFASLDNFRTQVNAIHSKLVGVLNLGVVDSTLSNPDFKLSQALDLFKERGPEVHINMKVSSPNEIERMVLDGRLHVGIIPLHHQLPGLENHQLHSELAGLYCGAGHPLFKLPKEQITLEILEKSEYISKGYTQNPKEKRLSQMMKHTATSFHVEATAYMIKSGRYIGFLPEHFANISVERQEMRRLLEGQMRYETPFAAIIRKGSQKNIVLETFLGELKKAFEVTAAT